MDGKRTLLLDEKQVVHRIDRLSYQIYEDTHDEQEIVIAGIVKSGFQLAEKIAEKLRNICTLNIILSEVKIDKHSELSSKIDITITKAQLKGKVVILVDDVLNSGKTMMHSLKPFLDSDVKKIRTVVLVDRNHKRFPVSADYTGLSLPTTLKEHVTVEFTGHNAIAWLS